MTDTKAFFSKILCNSHLTEVGGNRFNYQRDQIQIPMQGPETGFEAVITNQKVKTGQTQNQNKSRTGTK